MWKKEQIYHYILDGFFSTKKVDFTQNLLSKKCGISSGMVNKTIKDLESLGIVKLKSRGFELCDSKKLLVYWATKRNITKNIIYKTHCDETVKEIESNMPSNVVFTCYSGYRLMFNDSPSDYDKVYVYADDLKEIKERFPPNNLEPNLFVLEKPAFLQGKKSPVDLLYVDLWNLKDWFASEYLKSLERRIFYG